MMGIHDQALNAAAGFVPHPDELALEEVTSPKWAEEDEAFFRAGSTTYPACWKNKHSQRPQQLLPQPQESLQESRRRRGLGKLPEKRRDRILRASSCKAIQPLGTVPNELGLPITYRLRDRNRVLVDVQTDVMYRTPHGPASRCGSSLRRVLYDSRGVTHASRDALVQP